MPHPTARGPGGLAAGEIASLKILRDENTPRRAQTRHLAPAAPDTELPDQQENHSKGPAMPLERIPRAARGYFYFTIRYNVFRDALCPELFKIIFAYLLNSVNRRDSVTD